MQPTGGGLILGGNYNKTGGTGPSRAIRGYQLLLGDE